MMAGIINLMNRVYLLFEKVYLLSQFPRAENLDYERRKIGLIRFIIGFITLVRSTEILWVYFTINQNISLKIIIFYISILFSLIFYTIGFLTPLFNLFLYFFYRHFELVTGTFTLGTDIFVNFLLLTFLAHSGIYYSLDNIFLRKQTDNLIKKVYEKTLLINDINVLNYG